MFIQRMRCLFWMCAFFSACFLGGVPAVFAQTSGEPQGVAPAPAADALAGEGGGEDIGGDDVLGLDIEQLANTEVLVPAMSMEIETVSRTTQTLARTPAAVYVVTNEMIKRSGARNVPEVLRTVPGVNVARINASAWAISIRGLNARFAKNLLVQVDGMAIYSPTHSGVFWEREYVMLEDVERIEVIRGPGAAVWGVNAVNGVINIVTKSSKDTTGAYVSGGGGNEHQQFGDFRVGSKVGNVSWRMYGMTMRDDTGVLPLPTAQVADDDPSLNQGGFRMDWTPNKHDTFTFQGDFYRGIDNQTGVATPPATVLPMQCHTNRFLTRWDRKIDDDTDWSAQMYYYNPYAAGANINQVSTFDFDYQYHFKRERHDFVWGFGYRNSDERWIGNGGAIVYADSEQIPSYFLQDTITMVEDKFFLTLGSKFDHNSVTQFEYQPTVRATWTPDERTSVWGAVSRAVRTPSLIERPIMEPKSASEDLLAYEMGMRRAPTDQFFWELAVFFNRYEKMQTFAGPPFEYYDNGLGRVYGFELNGNYEIRKDWRLSGWYAFLVQEFYVPPGESTFYLDYNAPRNQFYLQSSWDLRQNVTLDVMFRYVDSLGSAVADYFASDIRLAWHPRERLELALVGQNLLAGNHYEYYGSGGVTATEIQPGVYGMVTWRY